MLQRALCVSPPNVDSSPPCVQISSALFRLFRNAYAGFFKFNSGNETGGFVTVTLTPKPRSAPLL